MSLHDLFDRLRFCRKELLKEREEMWMLHDEHHELAMRAIRQAAKARDALVGITILLTVEEVDQLFARHRRRHQERADEPGRAQPG